MPSALANTAALLAEAATKLVWQQWGAIGAQTSDARPHHQAALDPEALLLMSLSLLEQERRLADVIASWVGLNSTLLSFQRARNLSRQFPPSAQERLADVATIALEAGDHRWKPLAAASAGTALTSRSGKLRASRPAFMQTATLMLQLRQGMGIGVKSDVLAFLLVSDGRGQEWASVASMTRALGYTSAAVRRSADDLAAARFIRRMETVERETAASRMYMAEPAAWAAALHLGTIQSGWRYWRERYSFIADVLATSASLDAAQASDFAVAVACRELLERHRAAIIRDTGIRPALFEDSGDWPAALHAAAEQMMQWLQNNP